MIRNGIYSEEVKIINSHTSMTKLYCSFIDASNDIKYERCIEIQNESPTKQELENFRQINFSDIIFLYGTRNK